MLPTSTELMYFLEVANSLNLTRASERLGISQPSLSLAIKRLEQVVGTALFIRQQHGVTLTQAGKQMLRHVRQLIQNWESTKAEALASHQEVQGCFTIGCHSTMAIHTVSEFLPALLENYPKLEIQLKHDLSRKITEQVINLSLDLAIVANPLKHPDLVINKLCKDAITLWVGSGDRQIQSLHSGKAVILCDPDLSQTQAFLKMLQKKNITYSRIVKTSHLEVVASLTAKGCGIGILPTRVAQATYPNQLKQIMPPIADRDELCLIYRNENRNIRAIQTIIKTIKQHFA